MGKNMYKRHVNEELEELDELEHVHPSCMYKRHVNEELEELDELEHVHPSCMWGFVHAMDNHHWHFNVKRMLLQKINPRKRVKGNRNSKAKQRVRDPGELQKLLSAEEKHYHSTKESGLNHKRTLKTRIKSLITEDISKEENKKQRGSSFSPQSALQRTYSIHHLEHPDHGLDEVCTDWEHPIFFFPSNEGTGSTKLQNPARMNVTDRPDTCGKKSKELTNKHASKDKFKGHANVLESFKVNKELFLEIVQDKDGKLRTFSHTLPDSSVKARLAKSGSFPAADLLRKRNLEPGTLKQKQNEVWSAPKWDKLPTGTLMPKVDKVKHSKHARSMSLPLEYGSRGSKLGQALNFILESTTKLDERNNEVLIHSKELKRSAGYEVSSTNDCSTIETNSAKRFEKTPTRRVDEENSISSHETEEYRFSKNTLSHRRSSSLNESLDKYTCLFENNYGKEVNLHPSRSLKLRNECEMGTGVNGPVQSRRIRSLSNIDIYSSLETGIHGDANLEDWPITTIEVKNSSCEKDSCQDELKPVVFSATTEENVPSGDIKESAHQNELLEKDVSTHQMDNLAGSSENIISDCNARMEDLEEEAHAFTVGNSSSYIDQEINISEASSSELPQPCPVHAFGTYEEEVSGSAELQISKVVSENTRDDFDEKELSINCQKSFDVDVEPSSLRSSMPNLENLDHMKDDKLGGFYEDHDFDSDLDYVKDILENSGFSKDASHRTWHSSNQPLDPSIFEEMEAYWHKEFSGEDYCGCYHHQLLFDLVNEKLLQIYDRSFTYYPKALSSSCHIRPFPVGDHSVDEICTSVSTLMCLKPEQKQSLESLVALDLWREDSWMNLQLESECVGLELEDIIFDELLQELVRS